MPQRFESLYHCATTTPVGTVSEVSYLYASDGVGWRHLNFYALMYVLRGHGYYRDSEGLSRSVQAGDVILIPPFFRHDYGPDSSEHWDEIFVTFKGPVFDLWRTAGLISTARPVFHAAPVHYWQTRIAAWAKQASAQLPLLSAENLSQFVALLTELLAAEREPQQFQNDREWLDRATAVINAIPFTSTADWPSIASQLDLSYETFRKRFARLAGLGPAQYRAARIMAHAGDVLRRTDTPIKAIAHQCGFSSLYHFSRQFSRAMGMSPRVYRYQRPSRTVGQASR